MGRRLSTPGLGPSSWRPALSRPEALVLVARVHPAGLGGLRAQSVRGVRRESQALANVPWARAATCAAAARPTGGRRADAATFRAAVLAPARLGLPALCRALKDTLFF